MLFFRYLSKTTWVNINSPLSIPHLFRWCMFVCFTFHGTCVNILCFLIRNKQVFSKSSHTSSSPYIHQKMTIARKNFTHHPQSILALNEQENWLFSSFKETFSFILICICWVNVAEDCAFSAGFLEYADVNYISINKIIQ
jgi:hypothetical protein